MANGRNNSPAPVRQRLLNLAREKGQVFDIVLVTYGLERLMYRLSISVLVRVLGEDHKESTDAQSLLAVLRAQ